MLLHQNDENCTIIPKKLLKKEKYAPKQTQMVGTRNINAPTRMFFYKKEIKIS